MLRVPGPPWRGHGLADSAVSLERATFSPFRAPGRRGPGGSTRRVCIGTPVQVLTLEQRLLRASLPKSRPRFLEPMRTDRLARSERLGRKGKTGRAAEKRKRFWTLKCGNRQAALMPAATSRQTLSSGNGWSDGPRMREMSLALQCLGTLSTREPRSGWPSLAACSCNASCIRTSVRKR